MKRYWVSWCQPGEDYRPLTCPPNESVLGWWCSGEYGDDEETIHTLCALIRAGSVKDAKGVILKDWPEAGQWRFCREVAKDFSPGDRFPIEPWMRKRFVMEVL
jgi:hypothetical protein